MVRNVQMREAAKIAQLLWLRRRFEERLFRLSKSKAIDENNGASSRTHDLATVALDCAGSDTPLNCPSPLSLSMDLNVLRSTIC